jgi:hypothetical protein
MGETHSLAGQGVWGPNPDDGTDTLVLYVNYNTYTVQIHHERFRDLKYTKRLHWKKKYQTYTFLFTRLLGLRTK